MLSLPYKLDRIIDFNLLVMMSAREAIKDACFSSPNRMNKVEIWHKSYSEVLGYVRARMLFAVLRATNSCTRGSRVKWRMETEDGAGLPYLPE